MTQLGYIDVNDLLDLLRRVRPYLQRIHYDAEARHDTYGEEYMSGGLYEIMQETEELMRQIDEVLPPEEPPKGA
jgi:hypothetical protein